MRLQPRTRGAVALSVAALLLNGCGRDRPAAKAEPEAALQPTSVTYWTAKTELFMEHEPLVAGRKQRFAVHFTDLRTFKPVAKGRVAVALEQNGAIAQSFEAAAPSRPGIFGVDVQPSRPGRYRLAVRLNGPDLADAHELGLVTVYSNQREVPAPDKAAREEHITFIKEQQWTLDFATALAAERELRDTLRVAGEVRPRTGGEVQVTAPIPARIAPSARMPVPGASVSRGQTLAALIPFTPAAADRPRLEYEISEATAALELARRERDRVERLLEVGAVAARRLDEARAAEATASARLGSAKQRLAQHEASRQAEGGDGVEFLLRAPISGVIAEVNGTAGAHVAPGDRLFRIVAVDEVYVVAHVPEAEAHKLLNLSGAEVEVADFASTLAAGTLVSKSSLIDPDTRTLGVIFNVPNPGRRLAIGQSVSVRLFLSRRVKAVVAPEPAIVDDGGRPVVFVQLEGEAFARRPVQTGIRESGLVQITEGLRAGERVVTRGAYLIRLAALSTQIPAHGHVH